MGKSESVPEEKKKFLSANIYLYSSQKCFFFCSGKKVRRPLCGTKCQVSSSRCHTGWWRLCTNWILKISHPPCPGRRIKRAALTLEELGKAELRKIVLRLLGNKSTVRDSLKINGRKDSLNFFIKYGLGMVGLAEKQPYACCSNKKVHN